MDFWIDYFRCQAYRLTGGKGQGSLEYLAIAVLVVGAAIAAFTLFKEPLSNFVDSIFDKLSTADDPATTP